MIVEIELHNILKMDYIVYLSFLHLFKRGVALLIVKISLIS